MRQTAPNKQALVDAANEAAAALKFAVGHCEWCKRTYGGLVQHEIANGNACRLKARLAPFAALILCKLCHGELHQTRKPAQVLMGLAILYHSRGSDYDLKKFIEIERPTAPQRYTQHEVDYWIDRLNVVRRFQP
jgi:hypothetical protein